MPDIRNAAGRFARFAAGKAKSAALFTAKKTKNISRIAKLNVDISAERDTIKQAYGEIGKLYFETHGSDPESFFAQPCMEIENALEAIAAMEAEIARLKTEDLSETADSEGPELEVEIVEEDETGAANDDGAVVIPIETPEEPDRTTDRSE